jgi:release factor glutamine methyltransferase
MIIREFLQSAIAALKAAKIEGAQTDAEIILAHVLKKDRAWLLAHDDVGLTKSNFHRAQSLIKIRSKRIPISYVLGVREFAGLELKIDNRALTPRVETETIVAEVVKRAPQAARVLDIGTGSGAMAIALKHLRPDLIVAASEISNQALELARENTENILGADDKIDFITSDLFENIKGKFDIIVANLPYVTRTMELMPEVLNEPDVALFGGSDDGLELYRKFFQDLPKHIRDNSQIWTESDPWQQDELIKLATKSELKKIYQDYFILGFEK